MKEKKLSKDGLMDEIMLAMNSAVAIAHQQYPFREVRITQAREQIKSLIKAQAEPSEERIRTRGAGWGRGRGGEDTTNKEPSDAKLEEFVEEWGNKLKYRHFDKYTGHSFVKEMLKEYEQLKRGIQNG